MNTSARYLSTFYLILSVFCIGVLLCPDGWCEEKPIVKFARFQVGDAISYGIVENDSIRQISGDLFGEWKVTKKTYPMSEVTLLVPCVPKKILALAGNFESHLGTVPKPEHPEAFFKAPTALIPHEGTIRIPPDAGRVDAEAEMVLVIGKRAKNVALEEVPYHVLGVTCGNDVSARDWQKNDRQWWRAKGTDTFGPCGPFIVSGLDYDNLLLQIRVNGKVQQEQRTNELIHNVSTIVSWLSRFVTLEPGDLIFTGTPGTTPQIRPGDVVEVELEGVGVLRNTVTAGM
ncbi:MAG TPA: fumarylacetoacetate hydrolase family protein [bacterium]|nr:fumarylacetoacetate hydrolase family protein [bacterium]